MSFSWGQTAPDLNRLENIFRSAEEGVRSGLSEMSELETLADVPAVARAVAPHVQPIQRAVQTAAQIAGLRPGISFSVTSTPSPSRVGVYPG